ncbi:MAG: MCE family protein [Bacteroidaceae bacterium]|nr:MCE family protein [Bacteroidaceae bacterium]
MKIPREAKIGIIGVIALALLYFTIKFLQGVNIFSQQDTYYIKFHNAKALAKSSPVYADGYNVGIVSSIYYDYEHPGSGVIVQIAVEHGMRIPAGTTAVLDEAMLGGCTLNLMMGNSPVERFAIGDTIPAADNNGLMAKAAGMIPKLEATLAKVDTLLTTLNTVVSDPNIQRILANAEALTANLDNSSRDLNRLLEKDIPQMAQTFDNAGKNIVTLTEKFNRIDLEGTMAKVDGAMSNVNQMTERLNSKDNSIGLLLNDTTLYHGLNQTVNGASALVEDLKANPKRYVHFSVFGRKEKKPVEQ